MTKIVKIDEDVFIDLLWQRVNEFCPDAYSEDFWRNVFDFLKDNDWLSPEFNSPQYIVDNICVNGQIYTLDEIREIFSFDENISDEEIEDEMSENGDYMKFGEYYVKSLGIENL